MFYVIKFRESQRSFIKENRGATYATNFMAGVSTCIYRLVFIEPTTNHLCETGDIILFFSFYHKLLRVKKVYFLFSKRYSFMYLTKYRYVNKIFRGKK